jgi:hypothetical protein
LSAHTEHNYEGKNCHSVPTDKRSEGANCHSVRADSSFESPERFRVPAKMLAELAFFVFLKIFRKCDFCKSYIIVTNPHIFKQLGNIFNNL